MVQSNRRIGGAGRGWAGRADLPVNKIDVYLYIYINSIKHRRSRMTDYTDNDNTRTKRAKSPRPPAPPPTPLPEQTDLYFGWFSQAQQQMRVSEPIEHKFNGRVIISPPYCYWTQGDRKVLVTEITHSGIPTPRQVKNGDIYLGQVDKYCCRSYTRLAEVSTVGKK